MWSHDFPWNIGWYRNERRRCRRRHHSLVRLVPVTGSRIGGGANRSSCYPCCCLRRRRHRPQRCYWRTHPNVKRKTTKGEKTREIIEACIHLACFIMQSQFLASLRDTLLCNQGPPIYISFDPWQNWRRRERKWAGKNGRWTNKQSATRQIVGHHYRTQHANIQPEFRKQRHQLRLAVASPSNWKFQKKKEKEMGL